MRSLVVVLVACGGSDPAKTPPTAPPAPVAASWAVPAGWKSETIPFPLEFAPGLAHRGVEELRFAPGFFEPNTPGYWSYTFVWRTEDPAQLDPTDLGNELQLYFRGLIAAVEADKPAKTPPETISASTTIGEGRYLLTAHVIDAFKTGAPVDLRGWATRTSCGGGALWVFVLAPEGSGIRDQLDAAAKSAACGQKPLR